MIRVTGTGNWVTSAAVYGRGWLRMELPHSESFWIVDTDPYDPDFCERLVPENKRWPTHLLYRGW